MLSQANRRGEHNNKRKQTQINNYFTQSGFIVFDTGQIGHVFKYKM